MVFGKAGELVEAVRRSVALRVGLMSGAAREATQDVGEQCRGLEAKNVFPSHLRTHVPRALNVSPTLY